MNLLQYRSNEMFSSTELIRKSKMVFDKVSKKEIEKAVILRDGKPSFMLLDFYKYEELITEYLELKEKVKQKSYSKISTKVEDVDVDKEISEVSKQEEPLEVIDKQSPLIDDEFNEINNDDLEDALAQIENLDLDLQKEPFKKKEEALKDFWE